MLLYSRRPNSVPRKIYTGRVIVCGKQTNVPFFSLVFFCFLFFVFVFFLLCRLLLGDEGENKVSWKHYKQLQEREQNSKHPGQNSCPISDENGLRFVNRSHYG